MKLSARTVLRAGAASAAALVVAAGAAGCASQPVADRIVYVSEPRAVREGSALDDVRPVTQDRADVSEADRRRWVDENYGTQRVRVAEPSREVVVRESRDRYVPRIERVRERVVYVDRDPRWYDYVPPVTLGLSYWGGHGHRRGGWGWGLSWAWPGCRW